MHLKKAAWIGLNWQIESVTTYFWTLGKNKWKLVGIPILHHLITFSSFLFNNDGGVQFFQIQFFAKVLWKGDDDSASKITKSQWPEKSYLIQWKNVFDFLTEICTYLVANLIETITFSFPITYVNANSKISDNLCLFIISNTTFITVTYREL